MTTILDSSLISTKVGYLPFAHGHIRTSACGLSRGLGTRSVGRPDQTRLGDI